MKRRSLIQALPAASFSLAGLPLALSPSAARAQFRVDISGVGATQLPIAIAPFKGEAGAPQTISAIVRADLERSGLFRSVDAAGTQLDEVQRCLDAGLGESPAMPLDDSLALARICDELRRQFGVRYPGE